MKKLTSIDYLRAFSMLFIVGYWHLFDYSSASLWHSTAPVIYLVHVVLALFVFISGFLLGGKNTRRMNAAQFYKKRLLRIYPLYFLAVVLFYLYGINDGWTSIKGLLGISMYLQPAPLTLWFITMLVLFYLVTPALLSVVDRVPLYFAVTSGALVATVLFQFAFDCVDPRVMMYFPCFCMGLYCANHRLSNALVNPWTASLALVVAIGLTFVEFSVETLNYLKEVPLVAAGAYLIFYASVQNEHRFKEYRLISLLSYSSFAVYLFHRIVYATLVSIYFPEEPLLQIAYLMTLGVFMAVIVSWSLQKLYDVSYSAIAARFQPAAKAVA